MKHSFGSDNHSGVHPNILESLNRINSDFYIGYGEDEYSQSILFKIESLFDYKYKAFFALTGTGANVLALSSVLNSYNSVICPHTAHINVDECGSPELITGSKLIPVTAKYGKITPEDIIPKLTGFGSPHHSQPKVISISQSSELGTVYTPAEIKALADLAHEHGCLLHIDGSRLSNAAAALNMQFKEFTADMGADIFSIGGTKNGMMIGEVILIREDLNYNAIPYLRKQMTQLYSKNRYIAAQFEAYFKDDLCIKLATHANDMAKYLEQKLSGIDSVKISAPVETNVVFAVIDKFVYDELRKNHYFYIWDEERMEVRWMTSFKTTPEDIDKFIEDILNIN